ncbi:hypothetical protein VP01_11697g1, partial [Puccinia sorghi]
MPASDRWKGYINCKGWALLTFQCVVDGYGNFRDGFLLFFSFSVFFILGPKIRHLLHVICGGVPGSIHDSCVFRNSEIGHSLIPHSQNDQIIPPSLYLIDDSGYPADVGVGIS